MIVCVISLSMQKSVFLWNIISEDNKLNSWKVTGSHMLHVHTWPCCFNIGSCTQQLARGIRAFAFQQRFEVTSGLRFHRRALSRETWVFPGTVGSTEEERSACFPSREELLTTRWPYVSCERQNRSQKS